MSSFLGMKLARFWVRFSLAEGSKSVAAKWLRHGGITLSVSVVNIYNSPLKKKLN